MTIDARRVRGAGAELELRQLRALVALADHRSVTAAARALGLAQSTVSESLFALERALGTSVVVRRRGVPDLLLTAAGQALLPYAGGVLATLQEARHAVAEATTAAAGEVQIIANESISTYALPGVLTSLRERWPNARFAVTIATCPGVRAGVAAEMFDLGLVLEAQAAGRTRPRAGARRDAVALVPDVPLVVFGAPAHPLVAHRGRGGAREVPRDRLSGHPLFVSDAAGDFHDLLVAFFADDGLPGPHIEAVGSVEAVKRGVAADPRALGLLPLYAVHDELCAGRLAVIDVRPAPPRVRLDALLPSGRPPHPAIAELLDGVRASLVPVKHGMAGHSQRHSLDVVARAAVLAGETAPTCAQDRGSPARGHA